MKHPDILAIIPARGGSKGIHRKNVIDFCGKPLLAWSILQAQASKLITNVFVTSDDKEILEITKQFCAQPILRPTELSTDSSTSEPALLHALDYIKKEVSIVVDLVVILQATSPLREPNDIDEAITKLIEFQYDSLFSMALLNDCCLWRKKNEQYIGWTFDTLNIGQRLNREPGYLENGSIYLFKPNILRQNNNRFGGRIGTYEMPLWKSFEIDDSDALELCEYYFKNKLLANWDDRKSANISLDALDLIVYDFDGVHTDNKILVLQDGTEGIMANRSDGIGVESIRNAGIPQLILSTETNPVCVARARKLGLEIIHSSKNKKADLINYCTEHAYKIERTAFVGNDINDLAVMKTVGYPIAPKDAHPQILLIAKRVTLAKGGEGVIRELSDLLLANR